MYEITKNSKKLVPKNTEIKVKLKFTVFFVIAIRFCLNYNVPSNVNKVLKESQLLI